MPPEPPRISKQGGVLRRAAHQRPTLAIEPQDHRIAIEGANMMVSRLSFEAIRCARVSLPLPCNRGRRRRLSEHPE